MTDSADEMPTPPIGRRERKRRETRQTLVAAALSLFDTRGYDDVTVVDIAESADLDASTFFRHFGSKEAVLFTDMADFADGIGSALDVRPADEPLLEAIPCAMIELGSRRLLDVELEFLRGKLTESSSALSSLSSVYRERMVDALANAIARRLGTDPTTDPAPYLAATVWAASLDFYRRRIVATATSAELAGTASAELLGDVLDIVRPIWLHLGLAE